MLFFLRFILVLFITFFICACGTEVSKNTGTKQDTIIQVKTDSLVLNDTLIEDDVDVEKLTYEQAYDRALTLFKIPFIEQEVKTRFGNAHVIVCGPQNGEPLVLLHGMNASSTMWYPNVKAFAEHYRVYAIDCFLEPGKSQCLVKSTDTKEIVDWYFEIFDHLKLKKINLVGASRGGWLSVNIALRSPSQINKLALLSPAQTFGIIKPGLGIFSNMSYALNPKRKNLRDALEAMSSNVDSISQIFIDQYYLATKEVEIGSDVLKMQPFFSNELKSLKMPVLVLIGDNDIINGELNLTRAKRLLPNAQTGTISHAGHFLSMDQADEVDKKVIEFLRKR